jgi:LDH2 family malate/lactate/ureidoglycolate dehydrogenase
MTAGTDVQPELAGVVVPVEILTTFTHDIFEAAGLSPEHAQLVAETMVGTSLRGIDSHGIMRIPLYVGRLQAGYLNATPDVRVVHEFGATALVDGDDGMGHIATNYAMDKAIELALVHGVACVGVRNSSHFGAAGQYLLKPLEADVAAMLFTNGPPVMAPARGREARICNNPIALGVPSNGPVPIIHDIAMSVAAGGKIRLAEQEGVEIPDTWVLSASGERTTDPRDAISGILLPMIDHKGYGLAVFSEAITGVLMGSAFGLEHKAQWPSGRGSDNVGVSKTGHTIVAISCAAFGDVAVHKDRLDVLIGQLHATQPREEGVPVLIPGEPEYETAKRRSVDGIPIGAGVLTGIVRTARELGVAPDVLLEARAA